VGGREAQRSPPVHFSLSLSPLFLRLGRRFFLFLDTGTWPRGCQHTHSMERLFSLCFELTVLLFFPLLMRERSCLRSRICSTTGRFSTTSKCGSSRSFCSALYRAPARPSSLGAFDAATLPRNFSKILLSYPKKKFTKQKEKKTKESHHTTRACLFRAAPTWE
jgi:hypothetical protein